MSWHLDIRLAVITAVVFVVRGFLNLLAPSWAWMNVADWDRLIAFQLVFVAILGWLLLRYRRRWLAVIVAVQCVTVGLEVWCSLHLSRATEPAYRIAFIALALTRSLVLAWAVLRAWITPPRPAPAEADIDLYEAALRRGPLPLRG